MSGARPVTAPPPPGTVTYAPATAIRGPSTVPSPMASRRATSTNARKVPTSRTVVNPASTVARALATPLSASWAALRSITGIPDPWSSPTRWVWQSISPGSRVWPGRSIVVAPSGRGAPGSRTASIRSPRTSTTAPSRTSPASTSTIRSARSPISPPPGAIPPSRVMPPPLLALLVPHDDAAISHWIGQSVESGSQATSMNPRRRMPTRNPRHLAERHLPLRLMLVAFGLTFAVLAAMVASAALVPSLPPTPTLAAPLPTATTAAPAATDPPPSVAPSSAGSSTTAGTGPEEPPGSAPIALAAPEPATAAPGTTGATAPPPSAAPPGPTVTPSTQPEPPLPPAPLSSVEPTTTTAVPTTTTTTEPPTTTTTLEPTTTTTTTSLEPTTTTAGLGTTTTTIAPLR